MGDASFDSVFSTGVAEAIVDRQKKLFTVLGNHEDSDKVDDDDGAMKTNFSRVFVAINGFNIVIMAVIQKGAWMNTAQPNRSG
jgi:hypothetical protein